MSYFRKKELMEKRGRIIDEQEELLETARAEDRELTEDERKKFNTLDAEYERISQQIEGNGNGASKLKHHFGNDSQPTEKWVTKEGRTLDVYKPGQKISQSTPDVTVGQMARAMLTGARNDSEKRALSEGTDSAGGFTVPSATMDDFFDKLRSKARVVQAGARQINLETDETTIARVSGDPTVIWHQENTQESGSDLTLEGATFKPKTLMILVRASRELIADSVNANTLLEDVFTGTVASGVDAGILFGSNTGGEMKGLTSFSISEVDMGTDGATLDNFDPLIEIQRKMLDNNSAAPTAYIMAPREWETIAKFKDTTNQPLQRPQALRDIPFLETTNVPVDESHGAANDASRIVTGNWEDLVIGLRSEMRVELLRERYADSYQFGFLVHMRVDAIPARNESFGQITGIIP